MSIIVTGSEAINKHINNFRSKPSDFDGVGHLKDIISFINNIPDKQVIRPINGGSTIFVKANKIYEFKIIESNTMIDFYNYVTNDTSSIIEDDMIYPSLNILYAMKESHKYLKNSPHFLKTRNDILSLRKFGCYIPENFIDLFNKIEEETYNYTHPNLNQNKDEFFTDSIEYKYDHDTIHEAVKINDKPAYQNFIRDGSEVLCSKKKFFECSEHIRNSAVLEESYVLALERSIIPHNSDPKKAFDIALMKVCSSITSGWFREWSWENYDKVQNMFDLSFMDRFNHALSCGKIKPFKKD